MDEGAGLDTIGRWFAANLKAARGEMSQEAVAAYMRGHGFPGFRQQTVARIEAGERGVQVGEALMLTRAVRARLDDLTRAPELMRDATALRATAHQARSLAGDAEAALRALAVARDRLAGLVSAAREAGKGDELVAELRDAMDALTETATVSDGAGPEPWSFSGTSESVP